MRTLLAIVVAVGLLGAGHVAPAFAAILCPDGHWEEMAGRSCSGGSSGSGTTTYRAPSRPSAGYQAPAPTYSGGASNSGGIDPQSAAAIGNLLGQLLVMAINSSKSSGDGGASAAAPPAPQCTSGWCFPAGNPASFPPGSRQQIAAVCAMQSQNGEARYLSGYQSVDDCTNRLAGLAGYATGAGFGPAIFKGSDLPPPPSSHPTGGLTRCHCSESKRPGCSALISFTPGSDHVDVQTNTSQCTQVVYQIDGSPTSTTVTDGYAQQPVVLTGQADITITRTYPNECFVCGDDSFP